MKTHAVFPSHAGVSILGRDIQLGDIFTDGMMVTEVKRHENEAYPNQASRPYMVQCANVIPNANGEPVVSKIEDRKRFYPPKLALMVFRTGVDPADVPPPPPFEDQIVEISQDPADYDQVPPEPPVLEEPASGAGETEEPSEEETIATAPPPSNTEAPPSPRPPDLAADLEASITPAPAGKKLTRKVAVEQLRAAGYTGPVSFTMPRVLELHAEHCS